MHLGRPNDEWIPAEIPIGVMQVELPTGALSPEFHRPARQPRGVLPGVSPARLGTRKILSLGRYRRTRDAHRISSHQAAGASRAKANENVARRN